MIQHFVGTTRLDVPCSAGCPARADLKSILAKVDENALEPAIGIIISESVKNFPEFKTDKDRNLAFAAIFDFCVNLAYAYGLKTARGFQAGVECDGKLVFPFIKMCPFCSAKNKEVVYLAQGSKKPESATIGKIGEATLVGVLDKYFQHLGTKFRAYLIKDTAEKKVDLVLTDTKIVCLGEIKAKPLISYPVYFELATLKGTKHSLSDASLNSVKNSYLFLPHTGESLSLGNPSDVGWPYASALEIVRKKEGVSKIISAWRKIFETYVREGDGGASWVRYLAFGGGTYGGNNIDDSKNRPGLDRTDDIKKGTYQVLRYGANFAAKCKDGKVKSVLVGNTYAETHRDYFEDILQIRWTLDGKNHFNLFDAIIGITDNKFNDGYLKKALDK